MTREEFDDLLDDIADFFVSFAEIEEDADLNAICDEREGMPSLAVKLEDL